MTKLKKCPCGKVPTKLFVPSDASKWGWASGNCCGEWNIEFRTGYNKPDSPECMRLAIEAWNAATRWDDD